MQSGSFHPVHGVKLEPLKSQASFREVEVAIQQALDIVNADLAHEEFRIGSGSASSDSTPNEIPAISAIGPEIGVGTSTVHHNLSDDDPPSDDGAQAVQAQPEDTDGWMKSTNVFSSMMVPDMTDETSIYHIGTPTLLAASANPSASSSSGNGHSTPSPLSPMHDESRQLGKMATVKNALSGNPHAQQAGVSQVLKMIVLGDASVGKTALIQRFVNGKFQALPYKPTVGADFYSQKLEYITADSEEKILITLQIWDTAGQERYKSLASSFYRGADICIIVEDCTRPSPLATVSQWHEDFLRHAIPMDPENFPFLFLLNKSDLLSDSETAALENNWRRQVSQKFRAPLSRAAVVSAKSGNNVEEALFLAAKIGAQRTILTANQVRRQQNSGGVINLNHTGAADDDSFFNNCLC